MFGRNEIFAFVSYVGCREGPVGVAARLLRFVDDKGFVALRMQVHDVRFLLVLDC